jgi:cytochrome P450
MAMVARARDAYPRRVATIAIPPSLGETATGEMPHPIRDWVEFIALARDQEAIFSFTVAGDLWVWVNDPELANQILKLGFDQIGVGPMIEGFQQAGGVGLALTANYTPSWRPRRLLIQKPLSHRNVRGFGDVFAQQLEAHLAGWHDGRVIDVQEDMSTLTLAILAGTMFSGDLSGAVETIERFDAERNLAFTRRATDPTWTPESDPSFQAALEALDEFIFGMIRRRRAENEARDILGMLVHAVGDDGVGLDDRAIRDDTVGLIYAGHTTTANTLTFALSLLGRHHDVYEELRAQVVAAVGARMPTTAELDEQIPLAKEIVEETMRLYPVGDVIDRRAREDLVLGGYAIPAGTALVFSGWPSQHDERYFPEPERFDPGRFSPARRKEFPAYAYFPFSDGPKVCVGNSLSLIEASFALAVIGQRFDFELEDDEAPELTHDFLLQPKRPIMAVVHPRPAEG